MAKSQDIPPERTLTDHERDAASAPFSPQRTVRLDGYEIHELLGAGGMGEVYRAHDLELDREEALKVVRGDGLGDAAARDRLLAEARALAKLSHPNVVIVYDAKVVGDDVFVAMELVRGCTLREWMRDGPRELDEIVGVFAQAGRGLAAAHAAGLVHRDFKPANVLVRHDGAVKVVDFGLARPAGVAALPQLDDERVAGGDDEVVGLTRTGAIVGTPAYMAPEQLSARPVDARADQYAFCVALYEAVCGERPFHDGTLRELIEQAGGACARRRREPAGESRMPAWLARIIERGLAANPADRYPDMPALLADLARAGASRRRRLVFAAAAVILGLGVVLAFAANRDAGAVCEGAGAGAGVWDDAARARVRDAFGASGVEHADEAFERFAAAADRYAEELAAMRLDNCRATRVQGAQSVERMEARAACLDARGAELRELVRVLADAPDRALVMRAPQAAFELSPVRQCASPAALPAGRAERAELSAAAAELAEVKALVGAHRWAAARPRAEALAARAAEAGDSALAAEALLQVGAIDDGDNAFEAAAATYRRAVVAADAAGRDDLRLRAYTALMYSLGFGLERDAEATAAGELARGVIARLGGREDLEADYLYAAAIVHWWHGRVEQAREVSARCLELRERMLGPDHPRTGDAHRLLGIMYSELRRESEGVVHSGRALEIFRAAYGEAHPRTARQMDNHGILLKDLDRVQEAEALQRRAVELMLQVDPDSIQLVSIYINLGNTLGKQGRHEEALAQYREAEALMLRIDPKHSRYADLLDNQSVTLSKLGRHDEAIATAERAVALHAEKLGESHPVTATSIRILGRAYGRAGRWREALAQYQRSVAAIEASEEAEPAAAARAYLAVGDAHLELGQPREAQRAYARAVELTAGVAGGRAARDHAAGQRGVAHALRARGAADGEVAAAAAVAAQSYRALGDEDAAAELEAWLAVGAPK